MRNEKFKPIEEFFLSILENEADKVNRDFEGVICKIYVNYPPNDAIQHGFFAITLECNLNNADYDKTDAISFGIDVNDHQNQFTITADLAWGYPKAETIMSVFENPVEVTQENLVIIRNYLPKIISKLREQIRDFPKGMPD